MTDATKPAKIRKAMPATRDNISYELQRDIVIPKGTILRQAADQRGGRGYVECDIGHGKDFTSNFVVQVHADAEASGHFRKVIAA